jgi:hypothetical protein
MTSSEPVESMSWVVVVGTSAKEDVLGFSGMLNGILFEA